MKRVAIAMTLGAMTLLVACTNDFDALFDNAPIEEQEEEGDGDDDDGFEKPPVGSSGDDPKKPPRACTAPATVCEEQGDAQNSAKFCSDCGCECGFKCVADQGTCTVQCRDGSRCAGVCTSLLCDLTCTGGSTCDFECAGSGFCRVTVDPTSTLTLTCPGKAPAVECPDGTRVCGKCPG